MELKSLIIEMLDKLDESRLKNVYFYSWNHGTEIISPFLFGWNQGSFPTPSIRYRPVPQVLIQVFS